MQQPEPTPLPPNSDMQLTARRRPTAPRVDRRQRVPPALTRGGDRFQAMSVLDEVRGDLGLVLWRSLRNVLLWAETAPAQRAELFSGTAVQVRVLDLEAARVDTELLAPLSVIAALLERPAAADALRVVNACRRIALWAEQRGSLSTALEFTQAAAVIADDSAALAYAVGGLARRAAEYDRAESWYHRAIIQGRHSGDWRTYALAFLGMGNLAVQKGNFPAARRAHLRCLRTAQRHGLSEPEAMAYHDLFVTEIETGAGAEADSYAAAAFAAYGPGDSRVVRLAYDVAYHWALQGYFARTLPVAKALVPHFRTTAEQILVQGLIARSAAGVGDREEYQASASYVWQTVAAGRASESAARALMGVAYGAATLHDFPEAVRSAERALQIARDRREGRVSVAAEAALESFRSGARVAHAGARTAEHAPEAEKLAASFVEALTAAA